MKRTFLIMILVLLGAFGYTKVMARVATVTPPASASAETSADAVRVDKAKRRMVLLRQGEPIRTYRISVGYGGDEGKKQREGDEKTPEGRYIIDWRNPRSMAYLSLHISYPNADDLKAAQAAGHAPGGNIMIHGLPNGWGWLAPVHHLWDWTDGCVAVTNSEMREIWSLVPDGTPIDILP